MRKYKRSNALNDQMYLYYYNHWLDLAVTRFKYRNMPEEINTRCMELMLNSRGAVCFFKDPEFGFMVLPCVIQGVYDLYFEPRYVRVYSAGSPEDGICGYTRLVQVWGNEPIDINTIDRETERTNLIQIANGNTFDNRDPEHGYIPRGVLIWNNYLHQTTVPIIQMFAGRLANIQRTIDTNITAMKTPYIIKCNQNTVNTLREVFAKVEQNEPAIFCDRDSSDPLNDVKVLDLNAPQIFRELQEQFNDIESELAEYLGIPTTGIEKNERLIVDEVQMSQGSIVSSMFSPLMMRKKAIEKINKLYGLNIEIDTALHENRVDELREKTEIMSEETPEQETEVIDNE